jgi:hypothetical protein
LCDWHAAVLQLADRQKQTVIVVREHNLFFVLNECLNNLIVLLLAFHHFVKIDLFSLNFLCDLVLLLLTDNLLIGICRHVKTQIDLSREPVVIYIIFLCSIWTLFLLFSISEFVSSPYVKMQYTWYATTQSRSNRLSMSILTKII